ncbi:MAG: peptidylprolyl isomerase [Xanthomonadales bacterium]
MLKRILREPLLHFLVLGLLLFVVYDRMGGTAPPPPDEIVIDTARVETLQGQFERTWQRPPTARELNGLIESWLREEIFYREGLALGLDEGDPVVRRRIAQKMDFISEGLMVAPPAEDELETWFADNAGAYRVDPVYSLRQVYFDPGRFDGEWAGAAEAARAMLASGTEPEPVGGALLPETLNDAPLREVSRQFGQRFADQLADAPVGRWFGPVQSGFGVHLVKVERRTPGRIPPLAEVRDAVERDYLAQRREAANDALYESLRAQYTVRFEGVTAPDAASGSGVKPSGSP